MLLIGLKLSRDGNGDGKYHTTKRLWLGLDGFTALLPMLKDRSKHLVASCVKRELNLKPKIIVLCGSSRFCDVIAVCAWILERDEKAITMGLHLLPNWYSDIPDHLTEHEGVAHEMDELHLRKIDLASEVFIVNYHDYIGESTTKEINYAREHGKHIRWFTHDPIGEKVRAIINEWIASSKAKERDDDES